MLFIFSRRQKAVHHPSSQRMQRISFPRFGQLVAFVMAGAFLAGISVPYATQALTESAAQRRQQRMQKHESTVPIQLVQSVSDVALIEEEQRVTAIDRGSKAVASIIISRDLPNVERYYERIPIGNGFYMSVPRLRNSGSTSQVVGGGTAFFVSPNGLMMTNRHVVADKNSSYTVILNSGEKLTAQVVLADDENDIALLQVHRKNTPYISFAPASSIRLGQTAIAIGNSLGEFSNTVSIGVVSGIGRSVSAETENGEIEELKKVLQTDAAINRGNSGGPLLNIRGQVIGMNTAIAASAENIGFAIPVDELQRVLSAYQT